MSETERDELAALIYGTEPWANGTAYDAKPYEWSELDDDDKTNWHPQADAILAAGYRKPRTVTTVEELDKLADGSAVVDRYGDVSTKHAHWWHGYETSPLLPSKVVKFGPLTVIYEPEPQP